MVLPGAEGDLPALRTETFDDVFEPLHILGHGGPGRDPLEPALDVGIIVEVLTLALVQPAPGKDRHIRDGVVIGGNIVVRRQTLVEDTVEPTGLVGVATLGIISSSGQ